MRPFVTLTLIVIVATHIHSQDTEGLLPINGTELQVKTVGSGTPIIVIHGGPGLNYSYFLPQLANLSKKHRLIFFDQRASGRSSADLDSTQMTLEMMVDDIDYIRRHFGYDKVTVLGHSWGGLLAMKYAIRHPAHLQSLILVSTVSPMAGEFVPESAKAARSRTTKADSAARAAILRSDEFKTGTGAAFAKFLKLTFKSAFHDPAFVDSLNLELDDDFNIKRKKLNYLSKEVSSYDLYPDIAKIKAPVLIIHGAADTTPETLSVKIQKAIPKSKRVTIQKAGHFPFVERRSEFSDVVLKFVR
jgi:proline iminopeptidase